jgi:hypothetical protein
LKNGPVIIILGIILFCIGLTIPSLITISENKIIAESVFVLLWFGACFWIVGTIVTIRSNKKIAKKTLSEPKIITYKKQRYSNQKIVNSKVFRFIIIWISAIFFGFLFFWIGDVLFGVKEPFFYQIGIPGLIFGSFIIALSTFFNDN